VADESTQRAGGRLEALDALRGLIIVLMALDHASFFVAEHHHGEFWGIALPDYGGALSLLTRVVSHLCAPGFFLLMGAGMALFAGARREQGWDERRIRRHFFVRGAVLIVVDNLIVGPAWILGSLEAMLQADEVALPPVPGSGGLPYFTLNVLATLGVAMMATGPMLRFGLRGCLGLGVVILLGCQLLLPPPESFAVLYPIPSRILLVAGQTGHALISYPVLPWLAVCLLGGALGTALRRAPDATLRRLLPIGAVALLLFPIVRIAGGFGTHHAMPSPDWMGLLNLTKYPPSLAFLLFALGCNAVLLGLLARATTGAGAALSILRVFGRCALFFYVTHLYLYAVLGLVLPGHTSLLGMYPWWGAGLVVLYPACVRYERFKRAKGPESLWRLF
jgi:uncharacterized membrane protein